MATQADKATTRPLPAAAAGVQQLREQTPHPEQVAQAAKV